MTEKNIYLARMLCAEHWNPLGGPMKGLHGGSEDLPWYVPADEYDRYLETVIDLVVRGSNDAEIIDYLRLVETEFMGMTAPEGNKVEFVRAIQKRRDQLSGNAEF